MTAQSRRISPILAPRAALLALMALLAVQAALAEKDYSREHAVVASFSTAGGAPEPLAAPKAKGGSLAAAYVWAVVPESLRPRIVTLGFFKIYSFARSAADGIADCDDDGNWTLDFDYDAAAGAAVAGDVKKAAYFDEVLAHELAHVISLDRGQELGYNLHTETSTYTLDGVSYKRDSYLNAFYQEFWKDEYPEQAGDDDDAAALFREHWSSFVTEYAATDPLEDFAESFAYFVKGPRPTTTEGKSRKLDFFYAYPELVRYREEMRRGMLSAGPRT